jgi:tRNA(adenine34) deaminase
MVPESEDSPGSDLSRAASQFLATQWAGPSMMVVGAQDPVLGLMTMANLRKTIRGCDEPIVLQDAGHFVQEHGEPIAQAALAYFTAR